MEIEWRHMKAHELRDLASRNAVLIIPVASVEQHGPHLPVEVDTLLCAEIARRAAVLASSSLPVVVAPPIWTGLAEHHMDFGGTFTLDYATFKALLGCVCRSARRQGFQRIILLNGHGGNIAALESIVAELTLELRIALMAMTYWHASARAFGDILEDQANVLHACEAETSMMLALAPHRVDRSRLEEARGPSGPEIEDIAGPGIVRWRSFAARTATGVIGDARRASPEKGERLLEAAAEAVARVVMNKAAWALPSWTK